MILGAYTEELNLHSFEKETTCKITKKTITLVVSLHRIAYSAHSMLFSR